METERFRIREMIACVIFQQAEAWYLASRHHYSEVRVWSTAYLRSMEYLRRATCTELLVPELVSGVATKRGDGNVKSLAAAMEGNRTCYEFILVLVFGGKARRRWAALKGMMLVKLFPVSKDEWLPPIQPVEDHCKRLNVRLPANPPRPCRTTRGSVTRLRHMNAWTAGPLEPMITIE
jgi:hypothetical protein